jgi:hypothetical protein
VRGFWESNVKTEDHTAPPADAPRFAAQNRIPLRSKVPSSRNLHCRFIWPGVFVAHENVQRYYSSIMSHDRNCRCTSHAARCVSFLGPKEWEQLISSWRLEQESHVRHESCPNSRKVRLLRHQKCQNVREHCKKVRICKKVKLIGGSNGVFGMGGISTMLLPKTVAGLLRERPLRHPASPRQVQQGSLTRERVCR